MASAFAFEADIKAKLSDDIAGYWPISEGVGTIVHGTFANGVITGTNWSTDTPTNVGSSLSFVNSGDSVAISPGAGTPLDSVISASSTGYVLAAWYKGSQVPVSNNAYIVFKKGYHVGPGILLGSGNFFTTVFYNDNSYTELDTNINITDGHWHYVALSVNDSAKVIRLFLDGKQVASPTYTKGLRDYTGSSYVIGGEGASMPTRIVNGLVTDVFMANRAVE